MSRRAVSAADPDEALRAVAQMRRELDEVEADAVAQAVGVGRSWARSASAAGQVPISAPARRALEGSLREAARLGHGHLGPEHLLLSLLREQGGATRALAELEIAPEDLERCLGKVLKEAEFARPG